MIDSLLNKLKACSEAREWAKGKPWLEIYETCPRGDWLLWLFVRTNPHNKRLRTLAAGRCANTVRHLMSDARSAAAVDAAIAYGEGRMGIRELKAAARAAAAAEDAADAADATAATWAANAAWAAAATWAVAAAEDAAATAAAALDVDAHRQTTADIVRSTIPFHLWRVRDE